MTLFNLSWSSGKCAVKECSLTLVTSIGGGQSVCWAHALRMNLDGMVREASERRRSS